MCFVVGAVWTTQAAVAADGNGHLKDLLDAKQQMGFRETLEDSAWSNSPYSVNERRRKAPTWGPPRIPECM
jgi:hypothetical protein